MLVACHYAIPKPPRPELDAAVQDGMKIVNKVGGVVNFLYPGTEAKPWIPRFLCGFHQLRQLWAIDKQVDLHHFFSNGLYPYPVLTVLKKPVVFSTLIGLDKDYPLRYPFLMRRVRHFAVPTKDDQRALSSHGYDNVSVVASGIDLSRFSYSPPGEGKKFVLFSGSAPWNAEQFQAKGVELLLEAMRALPWLHVVFLWRGLLLQEMMERVSAAKVTRQVTVLSDRVDVNRVLAGVHAGSIVVGNQNVIKGYPHSLLETLAAGKPIIVSDCLPISALARQGGGAVVQGLSVQEFIQAIRKMRREYQQYVSSVTKLDLSSFSEESMLEKMIMIYDEIGTTNAV